MATVNPPDIERPKKYGRCGEIIYDLDNNMAEHSTAPQVYGVHTSQAPVIPNPLEFQPVIDTVQSMSILQSDETVKHVLHTQQPIHVEADGSSRYVSERRTDVYGRRQSTLKMIIEMFPPGSICKIYLYDIGTVQAVIHGIKFSNIHLEPALYIEFFKLEDVFALPAEITPDTLSQYPIMQSCVIYNLGQIESIDSSDAAEISRELIKNEMLAIKKQIAALKGNLRRLSRLRNSRDSTSGLVSEIHRKYQALVQSLERKSFTKRPFMGSSLPY